MAFITENPNLLVVLNCCLFPLGMFVGGWWARGAYLRRGLPRVTWGERNGGRYE